MLVLRRVMNSTYFLALRDCCCSGRAVAVVGVVVVVGVVAVAFGFVAALLFGFWAAFGAVGSPVEVGGAGVACGEELLFGGTVGWGDWGDGLRPSFCRVVTSWSRRLLTCNRASTRCWSSDESPPG